MASLANLTARSNFLEQEIQRLQNIVNTAPEGALIVRTNAPGNYRYYKKMHTPDGKATEKYLGREHLQEASHMAYRLYAEKKLPELQKEKECIDRWLFQLQRKSAADDYLKAKPGIADLLRIDWVNPYAQAEQWKNLPYQRNQRYPEGLIYSTVVPSLKVRSKAEADIVSRFEYFKVPYHYEEIATIRGVEYAIDFTCLNRSTNMIWYWDHRGMLDNPEYIRKTLSCDGAFLDAGIIQGINLIVTTETKSHPLDLQWVDTLIQYYLL